MAYTVIESLQEQPLMAFRASDDFTEMFPADSEPEVTVGSNDGLEIDDQGTIGTIHFLLVEDNREQDHVTLRLDEAGRACFWATGVEI